MKNLHLQKYGKRILLTVLLILLLIWFFPKSLVPHPQDSEIVSILYRADDWDTLRVFYPVMGETASIDEQALLRLLHNYRSLRDLIPSSPVDGIPNGEVTLWITVIDNGESRSILLGNLNQLRTNSGKTKYRILNADSLLTEALELLGITEDSDLSQLPSIAR